MNKYQMAKLIQWAETLRTRKRLQKVVYLLDSAGCPLADDYRIHFFGPYSQDVAQTTDELVRLGIIEEQQVANVAGQQYNYCLTSEGAAKLADAEQTPHGQQATEAMSPFESQARDLFSMEVRLLEVASTMAYFKRKGNDWPEAVERTCHFKSLKPDDRLTGHAEALARRFVK